MSDIRTSASVYIGFVGMERYDNQNLKHPGLNEWIQENVDILNCNYAKFSSKKNKHYLAGIYLTPEQATLFKLKFDI